MKKFTDIFIKRPVLATVVSLLILFFGLRAIGALNLRQFPKLENTVITVTTSYPGANANIIQGFITTRIQQAMASSEGIDYLTAESTQGLSTVKAYIRLNFDPNTAFTSVMSKVAQVRGQLPRRSEPPVITKDTGQSIALMYISFSSDEMSPGQITDYLSRVVQPKLETVAGVSSAEILGANTFAMRIWLNPQKMASLDVTPDEVTRVIQTNNFLTSAGTTKGPLVAINVDAKTNLENVDTFKQMVIKKDNDTLIRMQDIAEVQLGSQNYDSKVIFNGKNATFMAIKTTPIANPLDVINKVRAILPGLQKNYPPTLKSKVVYDATDYIRASIHEVIRTIVEATLIVILVIYLFLGSFRSVIIPIVTIPLSLIGVCTFMLALGYSINLLTLLAMVLAIGLVVDDAIVVVENIHRHIEEGMSALDAAIQGAREIASPVISMTITLAAVYAPIGFMGGLTGALFKEFAFTLAGAVIISGIVALTLTPMMCSKLLIANAKSNRLEHFLDDKFEKLKGFYERRLHDVLNYRAVTAVFAITVLLSCAFLYMNTQKQLAPDEDQSILFISATAPQYANIDYVTSFTKLFNGMFDSFPEKRDYFIINGMGTVNNIIAGLILKPWDQRKRSQAQLQPLLQNKLSQVAGLSAVSFPLPSLPGGQSGLPIQFVITSTTDYPLLYQASERLKKLANESGLFIFVDNSLKYNKPQVQMHINRSKAAILGINMSKVGTALGSALSGGYVNRFNLSGRSYEVIPQLLRRFRWNPKQLENIYIDTGDKQSIPLSTIVSLKQIVQPNSNAQFQQLNSATIQGMARPGVTMGDALGFLEKTADKILPRGMSYDYGGESRKFKTEGTKLVYTFFFSLIVIFLVLSAQFESFRDPFIILISVPMSICGALIPLFLGAATINIYTQVGLITLIGLISKHGILMVEFANKLQMNEGLSIRAAIEKAAAIRLRAVLMTTGAMIMGVLPLILASGAGAVSRFDIGIVIASGMAIGTLFTLFVVPTMYTFFAKVHAGKASN